MGVFFASGLIFPGQENGEPDMSNEASEEPDPCDPNTGPVEDFMKELGVVVEGISSCKNQQVSGEVAGKEENEGKSGHGHDNFAADGGLGEGTHGTERSIHGSLGHPAGA